MTTEFRGTPGPWEACSHHSGMLVRDEAARIVCTRHRLPKSESDANMRLIAAAPDLLAELDELVHAMTRPSRLFSDITRKEMEPWVRTARAAINKALGN